MTGASNGNVLEITGNIVSSHAAGNQLSTDELLMEIRRVYETLQGLKKEAPQAGKAAVSVEEAFQAEQVICMVCGKTGMKTLTRHLHEHNLTPKEYREQFGIPRNQPLTARVFSRARRLMAETRNVNDSLVKARAVRAAKVQARQERQRQIEAEEKRQAAIASLATAKAAKAALAKPATKAVAKPAGKAKASRPAQAATPAPRKR